jgi:hypothetical protein
VQFFVESVFWPTRSTIHPVSHDPDNVPARFAASEPLFGGAIEFTQRMRLMIGW